MKKILITLLFAITTASVFAQSTTVQDSVFIKNPMLRVHAETTDPYLDTKLLYETWEMNQRLWKYQDRQVKGMVIGGTLIALGAAGIWYTLDGIDPPVYQTSNPGLNAKADDLRKQQQIWGWTSSVVLLTGTYVFTKSFINHRRVRAEVGLNTLKIEYRLFGKRRYFKKNGSHPKELKNPSYKPKPKFVR